MRLGQGVEWAIHTCLNLTWLGAERGVSTARLAEFYQLPPAYLNKQLQSLVRAGILASTPGRRGGFSLARGPAAISLLDIVVAIEGSDPLFRCEQILRAGPGGRPDVDYREVCLVSGAMRRADLAWRQELAGRTLADLKADVERSFPGTPEATRGRFAELHDR
ncbi:RrF2 family transcriptional regulator [Micromonospora lutea]|uniref:Rrf2 family transcriptional regulator n=1 Tax=Micromonospora lutea TaxID=419825 RepID=A0ABQ4IQV8_9ACTN|nr:Rrf2 family transcriptional regulator [Micromonospora lutea]GIJ20284.1 Rrf2 family transcriptional regulator [Micromonospora lutea]